jgi:hypothetical protein
MYTPRDQPHFTPASVGPLLDPEFLRIAVNDLTVRSYADRPEHRRVSLWRVALARVAAAMRRHAIR